MDLILSGKPQYSRLLCFSFSENNKTEITCKPPLPPEWSIIDSKVGLFHLWGSQSIVLLKANPEKPIGNRRGTPLLWFVCHPVTWLPLQRGPSKTTLYLAPTCIATGHVPNRLQNIAQNHEGIFSIVTTRGKMIIESGDSEYYCVSNNIYLHIKIQQDTSPLSHATPPHHQVVWWHNPGLSRWQLI